MSVDNVRFPEIIKQMPTPQRVALGASLLAVVIAVVFAFKLLSTPSYAVAYANLDQSTASEVLTELDSKGIPYRLEGNGTRILVPRDQLDRARIDLAAAGINAAPVAPGYELLDGQPASMSTMRQQVDLRRALEGELARTLTAMAKIDAATVHLVTPERRLFTQDDTTPTASVLLETRGELRADEIETVAALVASAVEDLDPSQITVADTRGNVLHSPSSAGVTSATSKQLRITTEYEQAIAARTAQVIATITGDDRAAVVVTADLAFDETTIESEDYDTDEQAVTGEQLNNETYEGVGTDDGGTLGVDGGPLPGGETSVTSNKEEATREYVYDRTVTRTVQAPGKIRRLSVAVVMDDGSQTGAPVPDEGEIVALVTAAAGLDEARGDVVDVELLPFPPVDPVDDEQDGPSLAEQAPIFGGLAALLAVVVILTMLSWRRRRPAPKLADEPESELAEPADADTEVDVPKVAPDAKTEAARKQAESRIESVQDMIADRPDQIAVLVRTWLADQ